MRKLKFRSKPRSESVQYNAELDGAERVCLDVRLLTGKEQREAWGSSKLAGGGQNELETMNELALRSVTGWSGMTPDAVQAICGSSIVTDEDVAEMRQDLAESGTSEFVFSRELLAQLLDLSDTFSPRVAECVSEVRAMRQEQEAARKNGSGSGSHTGGNAES